MNLFTLNSQSAQSGVLQPQRVHSHSHLLSLFFIPCMLISLLHLYGQVFWHKSPANHMTKSWMHDLPHLQPVNIPFPFSFLPVFRSFTVSNAVMCFRTFLQDDSFTKGKYTSLPPSFSLSFSLQGVNKLFCITDNSLFTHFIPFSKFTNTYNLLVISSV